MDWFLYDSDLRHKRVKSELFAKVVNSYYRQRGKINLNFNFPNSLNTQALNAFPS